MEHFACLTWSDCHKVEAGRGSQLKGDTGGPVADVVHRLLDQGLVLPRKCNVIKQPMHLGNVL